MAGNSLGAGAARGSLPRGALAARCRARWNICRWWWGAWRGAAVFLDCPIDIIEEPLLTPEWPGALSLEVLVAVALAGALLPLSRCQVTVQVDFLGPECLAVFVCRMLGIDAPELHQDWARKSPCSLLFAAQAAHLCGCKLCPRNDLLNVGQCRQCLVDRGPPSLLQTVISAIPLPFDTLFLHPNLAPRARAAIASIADPSKSLTESSVDRPPDHGAHAPLSVTNPHSFRKIF